MAVMTIEEKQNRATSTIAAASVNLTKNLVGAGIFSLPMALLRGSLLPGLSIMLIVGSVQASSFVMIAFLCQQFGCQTYRGVWSAVFGRRSGVIIDACISINGFFICVAYNILVADFLQKALEGLLGWAGAPRPLLIWSSTLAITLPLSHARNLSPLRYTSMLGIAIIGLVFMYVLTDFQGNIGIAKSNLQQHAIRLDMGSFSTLALCTGAFQAHYNSPRIFKELGCSLRAHAFTVATSFGVAFLVYSSFAVAGLGLFGDALHGNVLKNYPAEGNIAILLAWLGMAFSIVFTYPLVFTTGRDSLISLVPALQRAGRRRPLSTHVAITSSLVAVISMVACTLEDVSLVTGLLGATIGSCLCWIFPASIYLKAALGGPLPDLEEPLLPGKKPVAPKAMPAGGGALVAYSSSMVLVGALSMSVGILKALHLL